MPYLLNLLFFFKVKYWKALLQQTPVLFVMDKLVAFFLLLLCVFQLLYCGEWAQTGAAAFKNSSLGKAFVPALLANLCQLFYFPGACFKSISKGAYYIYPISAYELNGMRITEGLFAKTFLLTVNLLMLPVFLHCRTTSLFVCTMVTMALLLKIMALLVYDLVMYVTMNRYRLGLLVGVSAIAYIACAKKPAQAWQALLEKERSFPFSAGATGIVLGIVVVLVVADGWVFNQNVLNKLQHE